jgi:hypothetical protein
MLNDQSWTQDLQRLLVETTADDLDLLVHQTDIVHRVTWIGETEIEKEIVTVKETEDIVKMNDAVTSIDEIVAETGIYISLGISCKHIIFLSHPANKHYIDIQDSNHHPLLTRRFRRIHIVIGKEIENVIENYHLLEDMVIIMTENEAMILIITAYALARLLNMIDTLEDHHLGVHQVAHRVLAHLDEIRHVAEKKRTKEVRVPGVHQ